MKISAMKLESDQEVHAVSALVKWEDCDRADTEIFFRVYAQPEYINTSNYNAFLVACVSSALHYGEQRIHVDGPVCPWLVSNLMTMMAYFNHWYWYDQGARHGVTVKIEAKELTSDHMIRSPRVGLFFSGGVDSIYTLRRNQLTFPERHAGRIRDAIFLHGFDVFGNRPKRGPELDAFRYFVKECEAVTRESKVNVIPVWTNIRTLGIEDNGFFVRECYGAALGAVAHVLSGKLTDVLISSGAHISDLHPSGSTPLTDSRLGSYSLRVHHDAEHIPRIEKVKVLRDWQIGLDHLRVCFLGGPGTLNCGTCEKCLRTKLALLCADRLGSTTVFQNNDLTVGLLLKGFTLTDVSFPFSSELIRGLWNSGHKSLATTVVVKCFQYYLGKALDVRAIASWMDKRLLQGMLKRRYYATHHDISQAS